MAEISNLGEYNRPVLESLDLKREIIINDVTLRLGEQAADVDFDIARQIKNSRKTG